MRLIPYRGNKKHVCCPGEEDISKSSQCAHLLGWPESSASAGKAVQHQDLPLTASGEAKQDCYSRM